MGNAVDKIIAVAEAEVGYLEKKTNSNLTSKTANAGYNNYTKYWKDLAPGMNGQSWCNAFVNWCFVQAYGLAEAKKLLCSTSGFSYYTPTSAGYFKNKKQWYTSKPQVGDIIYFKNSTRIHHVGIVYKVDSSKVYTIEGNTSGGSAVEANGGGVAKKSYSLTNTAIAGYGRPKYDSSTTSKQTNTKPTITLATPTVKKGTKNANAKTLQSNLNTLFNSGLSTDGDFGTKSVAALKLAQKQLKVTADAVYGKDTKAAMKTYAEKKGYVVK